jgi:hypothetical protein
MPLSCVSFSVNLKILTILNATTMMIVAGHQTVTSPDLQLLVDAKHTGCGHAPSRKIVTNQVVKIDLT